MAHGSKHYGFQKLNTRAKRKAFRPPAFSEPNGGCEGKLPYTAEQAEKARRSRLRFGKVTEVYRCPHCKMFHVSGGRAHKRKKK